MNCARRGTVLSHRPTRDSANVSISYHKISIVDAMNVIEAEELKDVILVGQSSSKHDPVWLTGDAATAYRETMPDFTNGAVSYVDAPAAASVHPASEPCLVEGGRTFYDLGAVA
jgi:hypothetical protein